MAEVHSRSSPIDITPSDSGDYDTVESASDIDVSCRDSTREVSPIETSSRLHESASCGSLDTHSSSSFSPTTGRYKPVSTAKPTRSCLSSQKVRKHTKSVTFAMDLRDKSASTTDLRSHEELQFDLSPKTATTPRSRFDVPSSRLQHRALQYQQMEGMSLKQYHQKDSEDMADESPRTSIDDDSVLIAPPSLESAQSDAHVAEPSEVETSTTSSGTSLALGIPAALVSPLSSSLRLLGAHIDQSTRFYQNSLHRAALPSNSDSDENNDNAATNSNWSISSSLAISAPIFMGLVLDAFLG